jgi:HK97 family phage portal protein
MALNGSNWFGAYSDPSVIPPNSAMGQSVAGVTVDERSVLSLMDVMACLRIIGDVVADLTVHVYKQTPIGVANIEIEIPEVISDPYADDYYYTGTFKHITSLGLGGNIYRLVVDRDDDGNPSQFELLNPTVIKTEITKGVKTYRVGAVGPFLNPADVVHVPWVALPGSAVGLNPIELGAMGFGLPIAAQEYGSRFFAQGISPGGILSISKPLMPADAQRLQQELAVNHGGLAQSHVPLVVDADAKWQSIAVNPETAQLLDSRNFSKAEIAGYYGVPVFMIGDIADRGGTEMKGIQEALIAFVLTGVKGYAKRLDIADQALLPPGYIVKRDVRDILKTNDQMLSMLIGMIRNGSMMTPNELRRIYFDLPPLTEEGADSLFAPMNSASSDWFAPQGAVGSGGGITAPPAPPALPSGPAANDEDDTGGGQ